MLGMCTTYLLKTNPKLYATIFHPPLPFWQPALCVPPRQQNTLILLIINVALF